jgi:hypothetical protein
MGLDGRRTEVDAIDNLLEVMFSVFPGTLPSSHGTTAKSVDNSRLRDCRGQMLDA